MVGAGAIDLAAVSAAIGQAQAGAEDDAMDPALAATAANPTPIVTDALADTAPQRASGSGDQAVAETDPPPAAPRLALDASEMSGEMPAGVGGGGSRALVIGVVGLAVIAIGGFVAARMLGLL